MAAAAKMDRLRKYMEEQQIAVSIVTGPDNQFYLSGFKAIIYSRPILLIVSPDSTALIAPGLEEDHAGAEARVDHLMIYYEHPEKAGMGTSPLQHLRTVLSRVGSKGRVGVDCGSCPASLFQFIGQFIGGEGRGLEVADIGPFITRMRFIKDAGEIELMKEAARLVGIAVSASLSALGRGVSELEVDQRGNAALFTETARRHPNATLDFFVMSPSGRERSVMPHVFSNTRVLQNGDVVIHSRQVQFNGYRAELERTCFVGGPDVQQRRAFEAAVEAQQAAMEALRPGIPMKEVDRAARRVIQDAGMGGWAIHRTGHGLGISSHEEPYLRFDNEMLLEENMVFSIEPGVYIPGVGGFRHSDTLVVTGTGAETITSYPRDLESLCF